MSEETPTPPPPEPGVKEQAKEQAKSMVNELWKVTFQQPLPGPTHQACGQAREFLLRYIDATEPK